MIGALTIDKLPPGQFLLDEFPRFGLGRFANRLPREPARIRFSIGGDIEVPVQIDEHLQELPRVEQLADFHCVTTWSVRDLRWSGVRFADFYECIVVPLARPKEGADLVVIRGEDGYVSSLPLEDALASDVLLADQLDGADLGLAHGAPLRLVAPSHYGYKNVKHIAAIEFWCDRRAYRFPSPYPSFMDHPRARVAHEERGQGVPAWLLRPLYRLLIPSTIRKFSRALRAHHDSKGPQD